MNENDYACVKEAIEAISQSDLTYWGSNGLEYKENLERDYPFIDFDVLMEVAKTNFHPPEDYYPFDCSVRHAFEFSITEYCEQKNIGLVCPNCGKIDDYQNDVSEFHRHIGRFIEQWGEVEVRMCALEMMFNEDGSLSANHTDDELPNYSDLDFADRVELIFPKNRHKQMRKKLRNWSSFRNSLTHNSMVKSCDGVFHIQHNYNRAYQLAYHGGACESGASKLDIPKSRTINLQTLQDMSSEIRYTLKSFDALISNIRTRGPCANFEIEEVRMNDPIEIAVYVSCEHTSRQLFYLTYDHHTRHYVESTGWTTSLESLGV